MRLLVTSVGSLVGQGVLDALEGRRGALRVIGCNASPDSPNVVRCDEAYLVPSVTDAGFDEALMRVVDEARPDVVVPGRDPDIVRLAGLAEARPVLARALMAGSSAMACMMDGKAATALFGERHGLPYVETAFTGAPDAAERVRAMVGRHGFPLIAKPSDGSGSLGVRALTRPGHVEAALARPGLVIQPFLDAPADGMEPSLDAGIPMFWEVPEDRLHGVQYVLGRDGAVLGRLGFRSRMVRGRCEWLGRCEDPGLLEAGDAFARAVAAEGWRGPFNVQAKRDREGRWRVIELNGRFTGGTSSRRHLGFDEVRIAINAWAGREVVPPDRPRSATRVMRSLGDFPVDEAVAEELARTGRWMSC